MPAIPAKTSEFHLVIDDASQWPENDDCTFFSSRTTPTDDSAPCPEMAEIDEKLGLRGGSWQGTVVLHPGWKVRRNDLKFQTFRGRGLVTTCSKQQFYSVTIRIQQKESKGTEPPRRCLRALPRAAVHPQDAGAHPYQIDIKRSNKPKEQFEAQCLEKVTDHLYDCIFGPDHRTPSHGVVVITGATNSSKSVIARHLVYSYLNRNQRTDRASHLVTVEDPIETYFAEQPWTTLNERPVNYTARSIPHDAHSIGAALTDALRQTPAAVYVGEVRSQADWQSVIEFAGTGHLLVTTAHAGSLVEAIGRILQAVNADTPAQRGEISQRILAIVHVLPSGEFKWRFLPADQRNSSKDAVQEAACTVRLPAVWRRTSAGIDGLVADGLTSVLPHPDDKTGKSSLGRLSFVRQLTTEFLDRDTQQRRAWGLDDANPAATRNHAANAARAAEIKKLRLWAYCQDLEGK